MADEFDFPNLTFAEIKKLKVVELKARLTQLGLPVSGMYNTAFYFISDRSIVDFGVKISIELTITCK
jgi:hypothetical protein